VNDFTAQELEFLQQSFDLARAGDTEELRARVTAGLPVNLTNSAGDTLLILAGYHQHSTTVQALLEQGADTSRVNDRGQTALAAAVFRRSEPIVRALLAAGADPVLGSPSALEVASFFTLPEMTDLLVSARVQEETA
jgi:ankyrin repeat protein